MLWCMCLQITLLLYAKFCTHAQTDGYVAKLQAAFDSTGLPQDETFSAQSVEVSLHSPWLISYHFHPHKLLFLPSVCSK